ncbi:F-box/LRR-repeat protein At3g26922-like [Fagus crenata]
MDEFERKQKRVSLSLGFDRISQLPQHILHHILFLMPTKDAARTSALSKSWFEAWKSLPKFCFEFKGLFINGGDLHKSVDEILLPLQHHKAIIPRFKLSVTLCHDKYASRIDNWLELANRNHVQTLDLDIRSMDNVKGYALPQTTFGVESLTVLSLKGKNFKLDRNYFSYNMKPICLRELSLDRVDVDSLTIRKILKCCPLLEALTITFCTKVERVELVNVPKLKMAKVYGVQKLRIEAPNLEKLNCRGYMKKLTSGSIACNNVKEIDIASFYLTKKLIREFDSKFPLLETLHLGIFFDRKEFKFSSHRLKSLSMSSTTENLTTVEIDCENLTSFKYFGSSAPSSFSITSSCLNNVENRFHVLRDHVDTFWFLTLGQYLGKFKAQHQTLQLWFDSSTTISFTSEELSKDQLPPLSSLENLVIEMLPTMQDYTAILDGLLWICHPTLLSTFPDFTGEKFTKESKNLL